WCGTCHDPHGVPDTVAIVRQCVGCHAAAACKRGGDCVGCHMPKATVTDARHVVYTDHSIPRRPRASSTPYKDAELVAFGGGKAAGRDLGLAHAITGQPGRDTRLRDAAGRKTPGDLAVLIYLAEPYRNGKQGALSEGMNERA